MAGDTLSLGEIEAVVAIKDAFTEVLQKAKAVLKDFSPVLSGLAVGVGVGVAAITAMGASIIALGMRGAEVVDVRNAFVNLSGSTKDADSTLAAMRDGVKGTVDDMTLMTAATHLLSAGVQLSRDDFSTLATASRVLAKEGFGSTKEILDQLSESLITGRTRTVARMVGVVDAKNAEVSYAASLGVSKDMLTESGLAEAKRIAILSMLRDKVKQAGDEEIDFKERIEQVKVGMSNFTDAVSAAIATSPALKAGLDAVADAMGTAFGDHQVSTIQFIIGIVNKFAIFIADVGIAATQVATVFVTVWNGIKMVILGVETALIGLVTGIGEVVLKAEQLAGKLHIVPQDEVDRVKDTQVQLRGMTVALAQETAEAAKGALGHSALQEKIDAVAGGIMNVRDRMIAASKEEVSNTTIVNALGDAHKTATNTIDAMGQKMDAFRKTMNDLVLDLKLAQKAQLDNVDMSTMFKSKLQSVIDTAHLYGIVVPEAIFKAWVAAVSIPVDAPDMAEYLKKQQEKINTGALNNLKIADEATRNALSIQTKMLGQSIADQLQMIQDEEDIKRAMLDKSVVGYAEAMKAIDDETRMRMKEAQRTYDDALDAMTVHTHTFGDIVSQTLNDIPKTMQAAFTGGGGVSGAIKSIGSQFGSSLAKNMLGDPNETGSMAHGLTSSLGPMLGGMASAAIPVIGSLLGPALQGVTKLFGNLFGTAGRDAVRAFADGMGGMDEVHAKLQQLGDEGEKLWTQLTTGVGRNNKDQATAAINAVNAALKNYNDTLAAAATAQSQVFAQLSNIHSITPALTAALQQAFDAKNPLDYKNALTNISDTLNGEGAKTKELNDILNEYGISWTKLGDSAKMAHIADITDEITHKFGILAGAGVNVNDIMAGMGPKINDFVHDAQDAGVEVPESMRKIIQAAIDQGKVFDANGNKITDISQLGLKFGTTMAEAAQSIQDSMEKLAAVITNILSPAINSIPHPVAPWADWGAPPPVPGGGGDGGGDYPTYGPEVFVPRPTLARVGTNGGEYVLHKDTVDKMAAGNGGSMAGVESKLDLLNAHFATFPSSIARSTRDAVLLA